MPAAAALLLGGVAVWKAASAVLHAALLVVEHGSAFMTAHPEAPAILQSLGFNIRHQRDLYMTNRAACLRLAHLIRVFSGRLVAAANMAGRISDAAAAAELAALVDDVNVLLEGAGALIKSCIMDPTLSKVKLIGWHASALLRREGDQAKLDDIGVKLRDTLQAMTLFASMYSNNAERPDLLRQVEPSPRFYAASAGAAPSAAAASSASASASSASVQFSGSLLDFLSFSRVDGQDLLACDDCMLASATASVVVAQPLQGVDESDISDFIYGRSQQPYEDSKEFEEALMSTSASMRVAQAAPLAAAASAGAASVTQSPAAPPRVALGHYEVPLLTEALGLSVNLGEKLGHGGVGEVFKGTLQQQEIAFKMLLKDGDHQAFTSSRGKDWAQELFKGLYHEARIMWSLNSHPNIIQLLGWTDEKYTGLAFQFANKGNLEKMLYRPHVASGRVA